MKQIITINASIKYLSNYYIDCTNNHNRTVKPVKFIFQIKFKSFSNQFRQKLKNKKSEEKKIQIFKNINLIFVLFIFCQAQNYCVSDNYNEGNVFKNPRFYNEIKYFENSVFIRPYFLLSICYIFQNLLLYFSNDILFKQFSFKSSLE